jgi:hypothetical protein
MFNKINSLKEEAYYWKLEHPKASKAILAVTGVGVVGGLGLLAKHAIGHFTGDDDIIDDDIIDETTKDEDPWYLMLFHGNDAYDVVSACDVTAKDYDGNEFTMFKHSNDTDGIEESIDEIKLSVFPGEENI